MIKMRPLSSNEELKALIELAKKDDHVVLGATHILTKNDEIVGYMSIGGITHVHNWFDTENVTASDSIIAISQAEAIMASQGVKNYIVACDEQSPFFSKMDRLGFKALFNTNLFTKEVQLWDADLHLQNL